MVSSSGDSDPLSSSAVVLTPATRTGASNGVENAHGTEPSTSGVSASTISSTCPHAAIDRAPKTTSAVPSPAIEKTQRIPRVYRATNAEFEPPCADKGVVARERELDVQPSQGHQSMLMARRLGS